MAETFQLDIVTPSRHLLSEKVEEVVIPGILGEFGVLA
ncbi:MAG: F0F1 ATP synthase subunit epsilon, partial [Deltaproteobacteria bacterium]|nr:F0F1 ATP synthase subunit epsilon [Deltaproteobacteria bacterium]